MKKSIIELRQFGDGTWSVMARVFNPHKKFYEHPTLINLTKEEAQERCQEIIASKPTVKEIEDTWVYIGD